MKKIAKITLAAGSVLAILGLTASPALAVGAPTLPGDDKLYVVECDNNAEANDNQLFSVAPETGAITAIGDGTGAGTENACATQGAQMPGTDWFYFSDWIGDDKLKRVNLVTGEVETIGVLTDAGSPYNNVYALTFGPDGTLYALDYDDLWSVNVETAEITYLNNPDFYGEFSGYPYAFAYDYVTEKFYVVEDGDGSIYEFDPSTGAKTLLDYNGDYWVGAMAFDSNGDLWIAGERDAVAKVALADFGDSSAWSFTADMPTETGTLYTESIWVAPVFASTPELPNTGVDVAALFGFAAALSIAGVTLVAVRRRA